MGGIMLDEQPVTADKKHLSFTQVSMYLKCPRQYELRYLHGLRLPASGAMVQSRAWHETLERNYRQKISSGVDLALSEMEEYFVCRLEEALANEEIAFRDGETPDLLKEQGLAIVAAHHKVIAPKVSPSLVEEKFTISLGDDFPYVLTGVWDVVEQDGTIVDNKAYGKAPTQAEVDENLQFTAYSLGYRVSQQKIERGLRMDAVIKDSPPRAMQLATRRTNADCRRLLKVIEDMARAISSGSLPPNPHGWWCSPRFCGYWGSRCMEGYCRT
jgi:CRISPR/Cas system-associated exonuclease Cas4 (RecB family)